MQKLRIFLKRYICFIISIFVIVSSSFATVDDDETLHFYWEPPVEGFVNHYKVRIYESRDGGESYELKLEEETKTSGPFTKEYPFALSIKAEHGCLYKIEVAGCDSNGNIGPWSESSGPVLCYHSSQSVDIELKSPLSFFSLPVQPYDTDIKSVLSSIEGKYRSVWYYDGDKNGIWKLYFSDPAYPSDLETIETGKGYWIEVKNDCILKIENWRILTPQESTVDLSYGINAVGYNSLQPQSIDKVFSSISGRYEFIYFYDDLAQRWCDVNVLTKMMPGKGYLIKATIDKCVWNIDEYNQLAPPSKNNIAKEYTKILNLPYSIWGTVELKDGKITSKDDCKVILKVNNKLKSDCKLRSSLYGDFYSLHIPVSDEYSEFDLYIQVGKVISKAGTFPVGKKGEIRRIDLLIDSSPDENMLYQNYPNPFNPDTWIPYQLSEDAEVTIDIYNSAGQIVRSLNLGKKQAGYYLDKGRSAYWDGKNEAGESVASGVYFYNIKAGKYTSTRKMIMIK